MNKIAHPTTGAPTFLVSGHDSPFPVLISESDIEAEIAHDRRAMTRVVAVQEPTVPTLDPWHAFVNSLGSLQRSRADAVLGKGVSIGGKLGRRGALILELVADGFMVKPSPFQTIRGRVLMHENGDFFTEKDLTKIGLDFADYLQRKDQA